MKPINIAIDGPAGAGKSTIAKALAGKFGYIYVDTGALYRSVGYHVIRQGKRAGAPEDVLPELAKIKIELKFLDGTQHVFLNGEDVSDKIRTPEVSMAASDVSAIPEVRNFLFDLQRDIAHHNHVVMDGRDIGTVVLPGAQIKIFLTASPEERARRRHEELQQKGSTDSYEEVLADVMERDHNDSHRSIAPLKQAEDAILVDTTGNSLQQSIDALEKIVREQLK